MRAILDTNVLNSAYVFPGGAPETVYRLALEGLLEIGTSQVLLNEFDRVLRDKFNWAGPQIEAAVAQLRRIAAMVQPTEQVHVVAADPTDDRVLEAALTFGAEVIVSGDRHLLGLGRWRHVAMLSPAEFLARWTA